MAKEFDKPTRFWVWYNGKYMAGYKSVRACLNYIMYNVKINKTNRKGIKFVLA